MNDYSELALGLIGAGLAVGMMALLLVMVLVLRRSADAQGRRELKRWMRAQQKRRGAA